MKKRIGEIFSTSGVVDAVQLEEGLRTQLSTGERLGTCLLNLGYITEEALLKALSEQFNIDRVDLKQTEVSPRVRDLLPPEFVRENQILPLNSQEGRLLVATSNPGNSSILEDIRLLSGLEVEEVLTSEKKLKERIAECYDLTVERLVEDIEGGAEGEAQRDTLHDIEVMASEPTVVNLVNAIISAALKERASDIHLVPFEGKIELRYRIDGHLQEVPPPPRHLHAALISRIKIMAEMNIAERFLPQDGHFQIRHDNRRVDVRVGSMPTIFGESIVMRLLEKDAELQNLEELGLDSRRVDTLANLLRKPHGIFLSTGPTGSGKTTTLYSAIRSIYSPERKILTIEDPVEYELPGVGQIPVKPSRGFTFATGLRAILRQDPDVIMVGEIRDAETAEIAIRSALTGHLVFSTLHTNDSAGAITRLIDMGVEAFLISSSLEAVLAQRLVRRICSSCKQEVPIEGEILRELDALNASDLQGPFYQGAGCDNCRDTGYHGRTGLFELLEMTPELRELILQRASSTEIKRVAISQMLSIREDGLRKATQGTTSIPEVLRVAMSSSGEEMS